MTFYQIALTNRDQARIFDWRGRAEGQAAAEAMAFRAARAAWAACHDSAAAEGQFLFWEAERLSGDCDPALRSANWQCRGSFTGGPFEGPAIAREVPAALADGLIAGDRAATPELMLRFGATQAEAAPYAAIGRSTIEGGSGVLPGLAAETLDALACLTFSCALYEADSAIPPWRATLRPEGKKSATLRAAAVARALADRIGSAQAALATLERLGGGEVAAAYRARHGIAP